MTVSNSDHGEYLGDGCYVRDDGFNVVLYTHNGIHPTNSVYLEPSVLAAFLAWAKRTGRIEP